MLLLSIIVIFVKNAVTWSITTGDGFKVKFNLIDRYLKIYIYDQISNDIKKASSGPQIIFL